MLVVLEHKKIIEEFLFWEENYFNICINKKMPVQVPDNDEIKRLLEVFKIERDYFAIMHRRATVKRIYQGLFIENIN